jgi:hypothetical protein
MAKKIKGHSKRISGKALRVKGFGKEGPMKHGAKKRLTKAFTRKNT